MAGSLGDMTGTLGDVPLAFKIPSISLLRCQILYDHEDNFYHSKGGPFRAIRLLTHSLARMNQIPVLPCQKSQLFGPVL
jgi:hypothetical protein